MKYALILLVSLIALSNISRAQNTELINSGELLKQGADLHDSAQYKKALILYNKISRSDTNYVRSLYERAITCEADSQFNQALKYCLEGLYLKDQREFEPDLYNTYGNILSDLGKQDDAIKVYDAAMVKYPAYSLLYFNKGIAYLALNKPSEAEVWFKKTLLVNPYMYSAHYQLALAAFKQGKVVPAFISAIGYLLMSPQGKYWSKSISLLSEITKTTDEVVDLKSKRTISPDDNYQAVEDIITSKVALERGYKPATSLDDPICRQIQAVFEKLEYKDTDDDFWIQYYLPYFKQVYTSGKFEMLTYHIFSNVKATAIQEYTKKNKKQLDAFTNDAADYFNEIRATRELFLNKRDAVTNRYYFEDGKLVGKGELINKGKTLVGPWEFYYSTGNLKGKGIYSAAGDREGEWNFYFFSGRTKSTERYQNGKQQGPQEYYYENGNFSSRENCANGDPEGINTSYYYGGSKKSIGNYKAGKKDGEYKDYYANGNLLSVSNYVSGVLSGESRGYYKSGKLKEVEQFINGKAEGPYKYYHENGALSVEGQNVKDNSLGEWKYYYDDGKLKEKRNYVNNAEDGVHEDYYPNGQISGSYPIKKDKITGEYTHYYEDGKVLAKIIYDNGNVRSAKYFDKTGQEVSSSVMVDGVGSIDEYGYDGYKRAHYSYNKKGNLEGADTLFYPSGKISQLNQYLNGDLNGNAVSYYLNGKKRTEVNMTAGKNDGYYTSYYVNGKIETEGWIKDGQNQGEWHYYDELGRLATKYNYLNDDLDGYREEYLPNGQKTIEERYHRGWLEKVTQYSADAKIIAIDSFPKGSGKYTLMYPNGKVMTQATYLDGDFDGAYKTFFFDGSPNVSFFFKKGLKDSTYISYYYGGIKNTEGKYSGGGKTGLWKTYDEDGKLYSSTNYAYDQLNGEKVYYFPTGSKDVTYQYKNDDLDGLSVKYDPDGTLLDEIIFREGSAISYAYLGKDQKLVPFIPIDVKKGNIKAYFPNGKLSREWGYSDGIKNGQDIIYYSNGQVRSVDTTAYNISEGLAKEFYPDGKLKSEYHYQTDNVTGICKDFDTKGVLKKELAYENGVIHGATKYYNPTGQPAKTYQYNYGTLLSVKDEK